MGSSPLARGGHGAGAGAAHPRRLIPARAGRTDSHPRHPGSGAAHPRSRGADHHCRTGARRDAGSSPLARGGLRAGRWHVRCRGLIPARAGRTSRTHPCGRCRRAHPRSRGAHADGDSAAGLRPGSSPLARSGPLSDLHVVGRAGLIPARAGRTLACIHRTVSHHGSSPLARGGLLRHHHGRRQRGLIPARAGRTPSRPWQTATRRAHPRSRGADLEQSIGGVDAVGSSPLARGGLRPAPGWSLLRGAHPRSRGADQVVVPSLAV